MSTTRIPVVSGINAGRGLPDDLSDWEITGFRDVRLIESNDQTARFVAVPVDGDSLKDQGILNGDFLICKITNVYEDGKIGLWQTPHGRTAKYAYKENDCVTLHNENGWRQEWQPDELKLLGIVIRVERDL